MFQRKIDWIFNDLPNVFGIVDYILVLGYKDSGGDYKNTALNNKINVLIKQEIPWA